MTTFVVAMLIIHILGVGIAVGELADKKFAYMQEKTHTGA